MEKTYDQKCYDLADAFLSDHDGKRTVMDTEALAIVIQETIEDWLLEEGFAS